MLLNGPNVAWTDAIYPALDALPAMRPAPLCVMDWGFYEPIRLLHKGKTDSCVSVDPTNSPVEFKKMIRPPRRCLHDTRDGARVRAGRERTLLCGCAVVWI